MRIVFFGTPESAVASLRALLADGQDIALVVTQPDRPKGRGRKLNTSPVKQCALEAELPVYQPKSANSDESLGTLSQVASDLFIVVAFGQIFRQPLLDMPPQGCVNVHFSLLPAYRGAAPVQYALLNGETVTGVTTMYMDAGLDTGDIIFGEPSSILPEDTTETLMHRLADQGAQLLVRTVREIETGAAPRTKQPDLGITHAPTIKREQGYIEWGHSSRGLCCLARALAHAPGCVAWLNGRRLRIWAARPLSDALALGAGPGEIVEVTQEGIRVACGRGDALIVEVQPEGKSRMPAHAFANGYRIKPGDCFEPEPPSR